MRNARALLIVLAVLASSLAPAIAQSAATSQASVASPANPSARLPTLEIVAEYGCPAPCRGPETFGSYVPVLGVAAGRGNTFAVLTRDPPHVHVWDLDSGKLTVFGDSGHAPGKLVRPVGVMLAGDTVIVAQGPILYRKLMRFTTDGRFLDSLPLPEVPGMRYSVVTEFYASPRGAWIGTRSSLEEAPVVMRINRATGANEALDVPASLIAGSFAEARWAASGSSIALSDDGAVAMGFGENAYRLLLIPGDASPRIEGGRSLPLVPFPPEEMERMRNPPPMVISPNVPPEMRDLMERANATPPDPNRRINPNQRFFAMRAMQFDAQGRIWVNTNRGAYDKPRRSTFDVFSPKLEYLGEITVDAHVGSQYHIGPQLMIASTYRENSTTVTVWRIREP